MIKTIRKSVVLLILFLLVCLLSGCYFIPSLQDCKSTEYNEKSLREAYQQHASEFRTLAEVLKGIEGIRDNEGVIKPDQRPSSPLYDVNYLGLTEREQDGVYFYTKNLFSETEYLKIAKAVQTLFSAIEVNDIRLDQDGFAVSLHESGNRERYACIANGYDRIKENGELGRNLISDVFELGENWYAYIIEN